MSVVRMNISLEADVARTLKRCAAEDAKPASRYLADLVEADARRREIELAKEGYRVLGAEGLEFAEAAMQIAHETWPEWNEDDEPAQG
jgi:hypothetical protein